MEDELKIKPIEMLNDGLNDLYRFREISITYQDDFKKCFVLVLDQKEGKVIKQVFTLK